MGSVGKNSDNEWVNFHPHLIIYDALKHCLLSNWLCWSIWTPQLIILGLCFHVKKLRFLWNPSSIFARPPYMPLTIFMEAANFNPLLAKSPNPPRKCVGSHPVGAHKLYFTTFMSYLIMHTNIHINNIKDNCMEQK